MAFIRMSRSGSKKKQKTPVLASSVKKETQASPKDPDDDDMPALLAPSDDESDFKA